MIEASYLAFGFALGFLLLRGEPPVIFYLKLSVALLALTLADSFLSGFLWNPVGRSDLGLVSFFLLAGVIDEGMQRIGKKERLKPPIRLVTSLSLLPLLVFSLSTTGRTGERVFQGLLLVWGTGILEWLLGGLRERLRLAQVPRPLEGPPILFWLAGLLFLAFWGFHGMHL